MPVPSSDSTAGVEELTVKMLRSSNIPYSPRLVNALSLGMLSDDFAALQTKDLTFCPTMVLSNLQYYPVRSSCARTLHSLGGRGIRWTEPATL